MTAFLKRKFLAILILGIFFSPKGVVFAEPSCVRVGFSVATVNGVFTDEDGAKKNMSELRKVLGPSYGNESIEYHYFFNPSNIHGLGDIIKSVYQKYFEERAVKDYDLANMIKDASEKVKTQKLLLVAHSQGNFYANSFYDSLADQQGGVPHESIAIYGVANPANRVAGGGRYITSSTDQIIAGLVDHAPGQSIVPANTTIDEVAHELNPFDTHGFAGVYLKYRGGRIVPEIQKSLSELSVDPDRREDVKCFEAPPLTLANHIEGGAIATLETTANFAVAASEFTVKTSYYAGVYVVTSSIKTLSFVSDFGGFVASSIVKGGQFLASGIIDITSLVYGGVQSIFARGSSVVLPENFAVNNGASVIGVFTPEVPQSSIIPKENTPVFIQNLEPKNAEKRQAITQIAPEIVRPETIQTLGQKTPPRLVFVGTIYPGFGGGAPLVTREQPASEVLGHQEEALPVPEIIPATLAAPSIEVSQCAYSLALDGCLLATTTVRFTWNQVENVETYSLNLGGVFATTTSNYIDITARDFSDYTFEIGALGAAGQRSATSTKTISLATIPIAINEIAWMGTQASANDEWIELKNNTNHTLDLTQWVLQSVDGTPYIHLQNTIAPKAFIILERTNNETVADVAAHGVYVGSLNNTGEQLALLYASTTLDTTPIGAWAAGINTSSSTRATMERYSSRDSGTDTFNWATNLGYISNGTDASGYVINGTPGVRNSVNYLINKGQDVVESLKLSGEDGAYLIPEVLQVSASSTLSIESGVVVSFLHDNKGHDGSLYVSGVLDAQGSSENPIEFNSFLGNHAGGLWFVGTSTATSTLAHVAIKNSEDGVVATRGARLSIEDSNFSDNYQGINAYYGSSISVQNTKILNNESDAFGAYDRSLITIASSTIDGVTDGDAIGVYDGSTLKLSSTTISNTYRDAIGIYDSDATIENVHLSNGDDGIGVYNSTVKITDTVISDFPGGIGIGVFDASHAEITNTEISHTDTGIMAEVGTIPDPVPASVNVHDNTENVYIF